MIAFFFPSLLLNVLFVWTSPLSLSIFLIITFKRPPQTFYLPMEIQIRSLDEIVRELFLFPFRPVLINFRPDRISGYTSIIVFSFFFIATGTNFFHWYLLVNVATVDDEETDNLLHLGNTKGFDAAVFVCLTKVSQYPSTQLDLPLVGELSLARLDAFSSTRHVTSKFKQVTSRTEQWRDRWV